MKIGIVCAMTKELMPLLSGLGKVNQEKINGFYNIFEQALDTLAPSTKILKGRLLELSCGALLCGSGTAVFAVFDNERDALATKTALQKDSEVSFVEVCTTMPFGVEIIN